jgi:uncharacterized protein YkwD
VDAGWSRHGYLRIRDASREHLILPILANSDLQRDGENTFNLDTPVLQTLESRLNGTQRASFRLEGPSDGPNNLFSWDSGHGIGGLLKPPVLTINYTRSGGEPPPAPPSSTPAPGSTPLPGTTPLPTSTPADGEIRVAQLTPGRDSVGWVSSDQRNANNFGDDDIYAGIHGGDIHIGAIQFNLSSLPANMDIVEAELLLTGQTRQYLSGGGTWQVEMLSSAVDAGWPIHGYSDISDASPVGTLEDLEDNDFTLEPHQLDADRVNRLGLTNTLLAELSSRRQSTGLVSFRVMGPATGDNNVFAWDSGHGVGGLLKPPVLRVRYRETGSPNPAPPPVPSATPVTLPGNTEALIRAINDERVSRGLAALEMNPYLMQAAEAHSSDMANNNRWSHTGSDGSTPQERMVRAGYPLGIGEEILAANSDNVLAILDRWLRDSNHENALMHPDYIHIGAGHAYNAGSTYGHYWTVLVARP